MGDRSQEGQEMAPVAASLAGSKQPLRQHGRRHIPPHLITD